MTGRVVARDFRGEREHVEVRRCRREPERHRDPLPAVLTTLADLRVQPQALAHFLLAVPDEVLRRCGVILAEMAREEAR